MTTPDLGTYQLKRSYVKRDIEYCYVGHGTSSISLTFRKGAFDHFDTVFVNGQYHIDEHRATERVYGLKPKNLVPAGYPYLDTLMRMNPGKSYGEETGKKLILIAPSHQQGNLLELCLREMVEKLCGEGRVVVVRPHPQYIRRFPARVRAIVESFKEQLGDGLRFELDFSVNTSVLSADLLITDWSAIAFEYAIVTKRPVIFVNTPPKIINPEWDRIGIPPNDFTYREVLGVSVDVDKVATIGEVAEDVMARKGEFSDRIVAQLSKDFCNIGCAGEAVGKYILDTLIKKQEERRK